MKKLILIVVSLVVLANIEVRASHMLGGEITWECLKSGPDNGKLIFTLKLYRACYSGAAGLGNSSTLFNPLFANGGPATITLTRPAGPGLDLSPSCYNPSLELSCGLPFAPDGRKAMEEFVYISAPVQINGVPAATGSHFEYSLCCRPTTLNLAGQAVYFIKATMFRYVDPSTSTARSLGSGTTNATCYDSSPKFAERPATVICSGYAFCYNHNAVDDELDSLNYSWTNPMSSSSVPVAFLPGYSVNSQLPGTFHSASNIPASIAPLTGEICFTTMVTPGDGYHSTAVKVAAYKCRQKVAEIYRDIPVIIVACPPTPTLPPISNTPPIVTFKWAPSDPVSIPLPAGDTVWAGDSVEFYVTSVDFQFLPGFIGQTNYLIPNGSQFGTGFSSTTSGCLYPPCATMDITSGGYNATQGWWSGQFGVATSFNWKTTCNHLAQVNACFTTSNTYNFVFKVLDNWCPANGMNFQTFAITVVAPPALEPPQMKCAQIQPNGNVLLKWTQPVLQSEDTLESFRKYIVMRSDSGPNGPYFVRHTVLDMDSLEYLDPTANAAVSGKYYFIRGISSCNDQGDSILGDTISSMRLQATVFNSGNNVALNWNDFNPGNRWGPSTTGEYYVHMIYNGDTMIVDTVTESWDTLQVYLCYPSVVQYFITVEDTSSPWGCISNSTIAGGTVGDNTAPSTIVMDSVSYNSANNIELGWSPTAPDIGTYYLYKQGVLMATLPGTQTTYQYTRLVSDPWIINFSLESEDTCGNRNNVKLDQFSMRTKVRDLIRCDTNKRAIISWNNYNPSWSNGALWTHIYRSDNNGPWAMIDSINPLDTMFADTSIQPNTFYQYKVRSREMGMNRAVWSAWDSITVNNFIPGYIIDAPDLRCISWVNDSTILLEWNQPLNPFANFNRYMIYHDSTGTGTGTAIDSVNGIFTSDNTAWATTSYTHSGVKGNFHRYYVTSKSGCDGLQESSIPPFKRAIDLEVTSMNDSTNNLQWNEVWTTQMGTNYDVYRDGNVISSPAFGTETANDKMLICDLDVVYRIGYPDGLGTCTSYSKEIDGNFKDDTPPAKQFVDSVSMLQDTSMTGMVGWSANPSKDVVKYYAMYCTVGGYKILDTVDATSALYYQDVFNAPLAGVTQYTVMAVDSCGNNTLSGLNFDCHSTMDLNLEMDFCDKSMRLSWNQYTDFASGDAVEYRIFASSNGGAFFEAGRTTDIKFRYADIVNGNNYCFYVQGWENGGSGPFSTSTAVRCEDALFIDNPDYAYMQYVTVHDSDMVRMGMRVDLESNIGEYWVKRSINREKDYKIIATIPIPDPLTQADSTFYYEDRTVKTDRQSYYYKIDVVDPCGTVGITSNHGRTMVLNVSPDNERNRNVLTWNQYEEWEGRVNEYEVYRDLGDGRFKLQRSLVVANFATDETVDQKGDIITFEDDVANEATTGNGAFCYYILAKEGSNTFPLVKPSMSKSNVVCVIQQPMFYIPTAFTPNGDGKNDRFLPLGAFHDIKSYSLQIFNRWGERIFSAEDYKGPDAGWDGTFNGQPAPTGAYVYNVSYTSADGKEFEKQGTITLTR